jgi:hypothetical protein
VRPLHGRRLWPEELVPNDELAHPGHKVGRRGTYQRALLKNYAHIATPFANYVLRPGAGIVSKRRVVGDRLLETLSLWRGIDAAG